MSSVFDDLIDQETVIAILKDAVSASKDSENNTQGMTHSWLFTGPPGSGRSNTAIAFAAALLCEKSGCGVCTNCLTVKQLIQTPHPPFSQSSAAANAIAAFDLPDPGGPVNNQE